MEVKHFHKIFSISLNRTSGFARNQPILHSFNQEMGWFKAIYCFHFPFCAEFLNVSGPAASFMKINIY